MLSDTGSRHGAQAQRGEGLPGTPDLTSLLQGGRTLASETVRLSPSSSHAHLFSRYTYNTPQRGASQGAGCVCAQTSRPPASPSTGSGKGWAGGSVTRTVSLLGENKEEGDH